MRLFTKAAFVNKKNKIAITKAAFVNMIYECDFNLSLLIISNHRPQIFNINYIF